jgi:N-acetylglucosamine-6-phosphate deacetylase
MSRACIKNGRVLLKGRIVDGVTVTIVGDKISAVDRKVASKKGSFIIDAKGCFVSPGFIDCHVHGSPEDIFLNEARHGTTAFVVAESCAPLNDIYKKAGAIKKFIRTHSFGPNVLGLRLEGPYISREKAGAQDAAYIRKPDIKELHSIISRLYPILKIMTIAPELKDIRPLIKWLCKHKIIASVGHSDATYGSAIEGIDAGISHSTHIFNAMSPLDRREPGVVGAVLMDDRVTAEIILDLIHVHGALFRLLLNLKDKDKIIIVTDSLAATTSAEVIHSRRGRLNVPYDITGSARKGEMVRDIEMIGGAYRFSDGRLAGSSLTMIGALKNAVRSAGLSLPDALRTITLNPATLLGVEDKKGAISPGKDADLVIFDKEFDVKMTMIRGRIAFVKGSICAG